VNPVGRRPGLREKIQLQRLLADLSFQRGDAGGCLRAAAWSLRLGCRRLLASAMLAQPGRSLRPVARAPEIQQLALDAEFARQRRDVRRGCHPFDRRTLQRLRVDPVRTSWFAHPFSSKNGV
jgi:hypothetical protein